MKYTLLELIQRVLSAIKGEEVNSYSDTAESLTVRDIIKECYFNLVSTQDFPELFTLFELNASGDNAKPVLMTLPDDVLGMSWLKYNGEDVRFLALKDFYNRQHLLDTDDADVATMTLTTGASDSITFKYRTDGDPQFFTVLEDYYVIFDSYDSDTESTLVKTNVTAFGLKSTAWEDSDSFTPDLDALQFNILLKDAKAMAFLELRQTPNTADERAARKARIKAESKKHRGNYGNTGYYQTLPNYGRK